MAPDRDPRTPPDLREIAHALEVQRPVLDDDGHRRVRRRVLAAGCGGAARPARALRSRLTITVTLVAGLVFSGAGAAIGVTALSTSPSASIAQYGAPTPGGAAPSPAIQGQGGVQESAGEQQAGEGEAQTLAQAPGGGEEAAEPQQVAEVAQVARQQEAAADEELPFTGYAAIPVLLLGLALLATGLVLRRRSQTVTPDP